VYIKGIKKLNPNPPGVNLSDALNDRCQVLLLRQRSQVRALITQLRSVGIKNFDGGMDYFELNNKSENSLNRYQVVEQFSAGFTNQVLDEMGSLLQVDVVENQRRTFYTLPKKYELFSKRRRNRGPARISKKPQIAHLKDSDILPGPYFLPENKMSREYDILSSENEDDSP